MIIDVLLAGIYDTDIRLDALSDGTMSKKSLNEVISFVENKEMARNAIPSSAVAGMSGFKRAQKQAPPVNEKPPTAATQQPPATSKAPTEAEKAKTSTCPNCQKTFHLFSKNFRGWNKKPHKVCRDCWKPSRGRTGQPVESNNALSAEYDYSTDFIIPNITSVTATENQITSSEVTRARAQKAIPLQHHIFRGGEWRRAQLREHPCVDIEVSLDGTKHRNPLASPRLGTATIKALADSGAQSNLWSLRVF